MTGITHIVPNPWGQPVAADIGMMSDDQLEGLRSTVRPEEWMEIAIVLARFIRDARLRRRTITVVVEGDDREGGGIADGD